MEGLIHGGAYFRNFMVLPSGNYVHHGGPSLIVLCWFFLLFFFNCKILLETSILRVKTPKRAWGAVLNVRGPVTMYIEVGGGGGGGGGRANLAVLSLWQFRTVTLLNLS